MATSSAMRVVESRFLTYKRTWRFGLTTSFVNPVLFLLAMGVGLGSIVDKGADAASTLQGVDYLTFLAPGLLAATAMQVAAGESTYPVLASVKWNPVYRGMLATPLHVRDLVAGQLLWTSLRLLQTTVIFLAVMGLFGAIESPLALAAVPAATLTGLAFAAPICAYSASLERDTGLSTVLRFGIVPMFLFSGTFFPISQLPTVLQWIAYLTPLWHGVDLCRTLCLGTAGLLASVGHVLYLSVWFAAGTWLAVKAFENRLIL
jgi:lipooligosaccharide transport system permease protein